MAKGVPQPHIKASKRRDALRFPATALSYGAMSLKPNVALAMQLHDRCGTTLNLFGLWLTYLASVIPRANLR